MLSDPPVLPAALNASPRLLASLDAQLQTLVAELEPPPPAARGRGALPILPACALWTGMLVCVLRGFSSQLALWRLLAVHGLWGRTFEITPSAVYDRLERGTTVHLEALFVQVTTLLHARLAPYADATLAPFATEVVAIDETVLERALTLLPALRGKRGRALLPGKLATVFTLRQQQFVRAQVIEDVNEREQLHARDLVAGIPVKSLLLFDLGYYAFAWFDDLTRANYWWVSRQRRKVSSTVVHTFYDRDGITDQLVWLGAYRTDQAGEMARMVTFPLGQVMHTYLTNVLDPTILPLHEIARLYARRWDIELAFKLLKRDLKLHLLWSAKPSVLAQQVWASMIIAQIILAMWVEIAGRAEVNVFEVSLALVVEYAPILAAEGQDPIAVFVTRGRFARFIRASRRTENHAPVLPPDVLIPAPPDLVTSRPARYATGQGSIPIIPAQTLDFSPPPRTPVDPLRRGRGTGGRS